MRRVNAFTLFEVLLALMILSVVMSGVTKLLDSNIDYERYLTLQNIENQYNQTTTITNTNEIKFIQYK